MTYFSHPRWRKYRKGAIALVTIKASAKRKSAKYSKGFNYPMVYEYGGASHRSDQRGGLTAVKKRSAAASRLKLRHGKTSTTGSRAFMAPALASKKDEAVAEMTKVLEEVALEFGRSD